MSSSNRHDFNQIGGSGGRGYRYDDRLPPGQQDFDDRRSNNNNNNNNNGNYNNDGQQVMNMPKPLMSNYNDYRTGYNRIDTPKSLL